MSSSAFWNTSQLLHVLSHVHVDIPTAIALCVRELRPVTALNRLIQEVAELVAQAMPPTHSAKAEAKSPGTYFDVSEANEAIRTATVVLSRLRAAVWSISGAADGGNTDALEKLGVLTERRREAASMLVVAKSEIDSAVQRSHGLTSALHAKVAHLQGILRSLPPGCGADDEETTGAVEDHVATCIVRIHCRAVEAVSQLEATCKAAIDAASSWKRNEPLVAAQESEAAGKSAHHNVGAMSACVDEHCSHLEAALGLLFRFGPGGACPDDDSGASSYLPQLLAALKECLTNEDGEAEGRAIASSARSVVSKSIREASSAIEWVAEERHMLVKAAEDARAAVCENGAVVLAGPPACDITLSDLVTDKIRATAAAADGDFGNAHDARCALAAEACHLTWLLGLAPEFVPTWSRRAAELIASRATLHVEPTWSVTLLMAMRPSAKWASDHMPLLFLPQAALLAATHASAAECLDGTAQPLQQAAATVDAHTLCHVLAALPSMSLQRLEIQSTGCGGIALVNRVGSDVAAARWSAGRGPINVAMLVRELGDLSSTMDAQLAPQVLRRLTAVPPHGALAVRTPRDGDETAESATAEVYRIAAEVASWGDAPELALMVLQRLMHCCVPLSEWGSVLSQASNHTRVGSCAPRHADPAIQETQLDRSFGVEEAVPVAASLTLTGRTTSWRRGPKSDSDSPLPPGLSTPSYAMNPPAAQYQTQRTSPIPALATSPIPALATSPTPRYDRISRPLGDRTVNRSVGTKVTALPMTSTETEALRRALEATIHCGESKVSAIFAFRIHHTAAQRMFAARVEATLIDHHEVPIPRLPKELLSTSPDATDRGTAASSVVLLQGPMRDLFGSSSGEDIANCITLLHGTSPRGCTEIVRNGFDDRVAALDGLFGGGTYCTNALCKANKYASEMRSKDDQVAFARFMEIVDGAPGGVTPEIATLKRLKPVVIANVCMGRAFIANAAHKGLRRPPSISATPPETNRSLDLRPVEATYDSVIGNGKHHKEFVVYDRSQLVAQAVVWYALGPQSAT